MHQGGLWGAAVGTANKIHIAPADAEDGVPPSIDAYIPMKPIKPKTTLCSLAGGGGEVVEQAVRVRMLTKSSARLPATMAVSDSLQTGLAFMCLLLSMGLMGLTLMLHGSFHYVINS